MSSDNGKFILGMLAGLAVGALLGVLFAPDKGLETRKKVVGKGEEAADGIKKKLNELIDELNQKIEQAKAKAQQATSDVNP